MSRCFPFPPPGYGARGEALIESIKRRKEMEEKAKKDREEKKREKEEKKRLKKEKKREKKEKRKEKKERKLKEGTTTHGVDDGKELNEGTTTSRCNDHSNKRKHAEGTISCGSDGKKLKLLNEIKETKADGKLQKGEDCENEQFERSGITEELEQPVTSVEPCWLSDSTQSSKRKRSSPQSTHDLGPIKIRLPLRKHRETEESESKSKFHAGSSSGTVGIADTLAETALVSNCQSQCPMDTEGKRPMNTEPKLPISAEPRRVLVNTDSRHSKVLPKLVHAGAVTTKSPLGGDNQLQWPKNTLSKRVIGNSGSRDCNVMQNSVDAVVTKNTIGSDHQSHLKNTGSKCVLGNSDTRHGKAMHNLVHRDAVVTKRTLGRGRQVQQLTTAEVQQPTMTEPRRALGNSDPRQKALQNSVHRDAVVAKRSLGRDHQVQRPATKEPYWALENSDSRNGLAVQNLVQRDAVAAKSTLGSDRQLQCLTNADPKRDLEKSVSTHGKAMQNLVPVDAAVVTKNAVDHEREKMESLFKSLLQIPVITYDGLGQEDEDWLFSSEPKEAVSKKHKTDSETNVFQFSDSPWPRAKYLPAVEIYALPYAVPF
ncbi:hypothetical protein Fmac_033062 [Flemingia macrophylla]|uniref:Uncharacterized protein n=1 Tax=Flemingia macrophylla TaxID=520843 RepID=A0ABD1L6R0_9FABA